MRPDTAIADHFFRSPDFESYADQEYWGLHEHDGQYNSWPHVIIWVASTTKPGKPNRYYFRFDLQNYPQVAPTACPWDVTANTRLPSDQWPKGSKLVSNTFNPGWNPNALYAPCDRLAMPGHEAWQQQFPELWWQASFTLTVYLHFLHRLLNSADYARS